MKIEQILQNAKGERKGDIKIYAYYLEMLARSEAINKPYDEYKALVEKLKEIMEV